MDKQQAAVFIRSQGWLSTTPSDFQDRLLSRCDLLTLDAGQVAFRAGDDAGGLFGIVEGRIELHLDLKSDDPTLGYICGPGYWVGDNATIARRRRRLTMVAGSVGCQALRLPRAEMLRMTQYDPGEWRYFAELLARNYLNAMDVIDALKRSDPVERVAATLCNLLDGSSDGQNTVNASQSDFGSLTQLGRGTVNAALNSLEKKDLVRRRYGSIEIPSVSALREFVWEPKEK